MLTIAGKRFGSRLLTGTGKFSSAVQMEKALLASSSELVTVALKRVDLKDEDDDILNHLRYPHISLLPNTSGVRNAREAVFAAQLAREALETNWIKLEIHPDPKYLMPDPIETLKATEELAKLGFIVLPYIHADPVLCKRLEDAGTSAVMPLGSAIGSNKGCNIACCATAKTDIGIIVSPAIHCSCYRATESDRIRLGAIALRLADRLCNIRNRIDRHSSRN